MSLLAPLLLAASLAEPIPGAFGLHFGEAVDSVVIGASIGNPRYSLPPRNLDQTPPASWPEATPAWYRFTPDVVPEALRGGDISLSVLLDDNGHPARILFEKPHNDCKELYDWLTDNLAKKYRAGDDPTVSPRKGFGIGARFINADRQIDVSCGSSLLVEYTDLNAYQMWRNARASALDDYHGRQRAIEQMAAKVQLQRDREFAGNFTIGDRFRIDGGLGISFGTPYAATADWEPDAPFAAALGNLKPPFDEGVYELTLSPDAQPIRISGNLPDLQGDRFKRVATAAQAKYGTPMKDGETHKIYKVNGNFLILHRLPRLGQMTLTLIDARAQKAQRARAEAVLQEAFDEETAGL